MVKFDLTGYFSLSSTTATEDGAADGGDGEDRGQHDRNQIAQAVLFDEAVDGVNNEESNNKTTSSKNKKRNKKKRQKAKAKKQLQQQQQQQQAANNDNNHNDDKTLSSSSRSTKKCSFGNVSTREYQRCFMGSDGVPNDGGWPLGLGDKLIYEYNTSVDTYEDLKQQELRERYQTFLKMEAQQQGHSKQQQQQKKTKEEQHLSSTSNNNNNHENIGDDIYFETRQYDYRRQSSDGVGHMKDSNKDTKVIDNYGRNPLFKPCNEDTRKFLIIRDHEITVDEMLKSTNKIPSHNILRKESTSSSHHSSHHSSNNHHNNENGNHHQSNNNARRPRSNSFQRKRSNSFNHHDESSSSTSNHSFSSHDIRHVRNELEHIRISRSSTASSGCNCKKQTFYFPTVVAQQEEQSINNNTSSSPKKAKSSSSKKRHNHHPLTERRLREEIRKRRNIELSTNINNASREEMEAKLYEHMKNEPCCWSMDCPCVKSGIGCQADCCSCWKNNNNNSNKEHQDESNTQRIQSICGNPNGMYVVDMDGISQYRKNIIGCMEVSEKLKKDCAPIYADIRRKSLS